jgi:hypothetical protein
MSVTLVRFFACIDVGGFLYGWIVIRCDGAGNARGND